MIDGQMVEVVAPNEGMQVVEQGESSTMDAVEIVQQLEGTIVVRTDNNWATPISWDDLAVGFVMKLTVHTDHYFNELYTIWAFQHIFGWAFMISP